VGGQRTAVAHKDGWVSIPRKAIPRISIQRKWPPKFSSIAGVAKIALRAILA